MPLPGSNRKRQFIQEVVEPEVSTPVEPEVLQEIVEEAPVEEEIVEEETTEEKSGSDARAKFIARLKAKAQTIKK